MKNKGVELAVGNMVVVGIVVLVVLVVMIVFGPKLLGLGETGKEFFGFDVCPHTGKTVGEYEVGMQESLARQNVEKALEQYEEFKACFPDKKPALSQSQLDFLEYQLTRKFYVKQGDTAETLTRLNTLAKSDNPVVSSEAYFLAGKIYQAEKEKDDAMAMFSALISRHADSKLPAVQVKVGYAYWYLGDSEKAVDSFKIALTSADNDVKLSAADGLLAIARETVNFCKTYKMSPEEARYWKEDGINAVEALTDVFKRGTPKYAEALDVRAELKKECKQEKFI